LDARGLVDLLLVDNLSMTQPFRPLVPFGITFGGVCFMLSMLIPISGCTSQQAPKPAQTASSKLVLPLPSNEDLSAEDEAEVNRALVAVQERDIPTTLGIIRKMTPKSSTSADLSERLAATCRAFGEVDLAWRFAKQAVAIAPDSASALLVLSVTESDLDWPANVGERIKRIKQLAPNSVEPLLALATFYQAAAQYKEAEAEYRALIAMDADNPAGWGMLATNLHLQKRIAEARTVLEEAAKRSDPNDPAIWILSAKLDIDEAEANPAQADALYKKALASLEEGIKVAPVPAAYMALGRVREATGDLKGALDAFEKSYAMLPDQVGLRPRLARLRVRAGQTAKGEKLITEEQKAVESKDRLTRAVNGSGANLSDVERHRVVALEADKRKMSSRARLEWSIIAHLNPGDPQATKRLAVLRKGVPDVPFPKVFP
jgi:tetratricopeptide (TPR) repeat protein